MSTVVHDSDVSPGWDTATMERRIALVRLVILFAILPLLWWDVISPESEMALTGLTALIAAYILGTFLILPRLRAAPRKDIFLSIDIVAAAALVYFTGGINSSLLFLLYLPILAAAVRLDLRQTFLSAIAVSAIVVWMWNVAEGGLPSLGSVAARVGVFSFGSLLTALIFGTLAQETRLSRERASLNSILNERLAEATEQLRGRLAELESSYDFSGRLATATETSVVLESIAEAARQRLQAPISAVFLYERLGGALSPAVARGISAEAAAPMMYACADRLVEDLPQPAFVETPEGNGWSRGACAAISAGGRLIGAVCAGGDEHWTCTDSALKALANTADQGGVALERAALLEDLQRLALADPTARLYPRDQLDRILRDEVKRAAQLEVPFALLKLRIAAPVAGGSQLLHKHLATRILESARRVDVVAQGEEGEFFILMPMTNIDAAERFAAELRQRLADDSAALRLAARQGALDIRIGIATFPVDATTGPELSYAAGSALEAADPSTPIIRAATLMPADRAVSVSQKGPSGKRASV